MRSRGEIKRYEVFRTGPEMVMVNGGSGSLGSMLTSSSPQPWICRSCSCRSDQRPIRWRPGVSFATTSTPIEPFNDMGIVSARNCS